jgi:hypothetical protein
MHLYCRTRHSLETRTRDLLQTPTVVLKTSRQGVFSKNVFLVALPTSSHNMPSPRPRPSDRSNLTMTPENIRTGVIVSVVVSLVAIAILAYVALKSLLNRGVKMGTRRNVEAERRIKEDRGQEVGVVREPLPAYHKEPRNSEKTLAMAGEDGGQ